MAGVGLLLTKFATAATKIQLAVLCRAGLDRILCEVTYGFGSWPYCLVESPDDGDDGAGVVSIVRMGPAPSL